MKEKQSKDILSIPVGGWYIDDFTGEYIVLTKEERKALKEFRNEQSK